MEAGPPAPARSSADCGLLASRRLLPPARPAGRGLLGGAAAQDGVVARGGAATRAGLGRSCDCIRVLTTSKGVISSADRIDPNDAAAAFAWGGRRSSAMTGAEASKESSMALPAPGGNDARPTPVQPAPAVAGACGESRAKLQPRPPGAARWPRPAAAPTTRMSPAEPALTQRLHSPRRAPDHAAGARSRAGCSALGAPRPPRVTKGRCAKGFERHVAARASGRGARLLGVGGDGAALFCRNAARG